MNSITKRMMETEQIEKLVKKAFGQKCQMKEAVLLTEGCFNAAYLISLNDGREAILKISPPLSVKTLSYEKGIMGTEVGVLKLLKEDGRVPVPKVLYYDDSCQLIDSEYFFMEKLVGTPYHKIKDSLPIDKRSRIESELGRNNRLINEIIGKHFGYFAECMPRYDNWTDCFYAMMEGILRDGEALGIGLPISYDEIRRYLETKKDVLSDVTVPRLVHWDLWDGNVFVDEKGKITGIIDFERALWGDPLMEVYYCCFYNPVHFNVGYGKNLMENTNSNQKRNLYNLYVLLIMVIEYDYRQYDDLGYKGWVYGLLEKEIEILRQS